MDINTYLNMLLPPLKTETILMAIDLKFFDRLDKAITAKELAGKMALSPRNTKFPLRSSMAK